MSDPRIGKIGVARVAWPNGRTTETEGEIIAIDEAANEVYLESQYGPVAGDLDTLDVFED
jgi:hypothetical protein